MRVVAVEADVRPERRTRERDIADADGLVLQNVHVHSGSRSPGLLKRSSQVGAVGLVIAGLSMISSASWSGISSTPSANCTSREPQRGHSCRFGS
ncbi:hypothetical protein [Bradyrhizobium paxllaeri]|uniref:hypothetical protein n=1 Tax=Bradyrhizobium paxllaeri TaxID=190148 RepID=UPI000810B308|nr:hypothetical protein [Bradyrhizobium paxllaeri]